MASLGASTNRSGAFLAAVSSLIFWVCLFVAAVLYAAVALSSKIAAYDALRAEHESNQWRLVDLEQQVGRLRKFIAAQKDDPAFVREQAHADFELAHSDEQRIPVDSHLTLQISPLRGSPTERSVAPAPYAPLVHLVATSRPLADGLLAGAAALVIGAFALLPVRRSTEEDDSQSAE